MLKQKTRTNPVFWPERLAAMWSLSPHGRERFDDARTNPASTDLLTWNVFSALDTHDFPERLAHRLQSFGGATVRPPVRSSLWVGREREPLLRPGDGYLAQVRRRTASYGGSEDSLADFAAPVEVPVLLETPEVVVLVDTTLDRLPAGRGGRDRVVELIDVGLDLARRLGKQLAVAVLHSASSSGAPDIRRRIDQLRDPAELRAALNHRSDLAAVLLRAVTWQSLLGDFEADLEYMRLDGQPVRRFLEHTRTLGLR